MKITVFSTDAPTRTATELQEHDKTRRSELIRYSPSYIHLEDYIYVPQVLGVVDGIKFDDVVVVAMLPGMPWFYNHLQDTIMALRTNAHNRRLFVVAPTAGKIYRAMSEDQRRFVDWVKAMVPIVDTLKTVAETLIALNNEIVGPVGEVTDL